MENWNHHWDNILRLHDSIEYQSCCTRKNCAMSAIWFVVKYCHERLPQVAKFATGGGCIIYDLNNFSSFYKYMTNTEKRIISNSCFAYACRQNFSNHFLLITRTPTNTYYFYHPWFLNDIPMCQHYVLTKLLPWKKSLSKEDQFRIFSIMNNYLEIWNIT